MALNFSFNIGYLLETGTYDHNAESNPVAQLSSTNISGNIKVTLYPRWYEHTAVEWSIPADWGNCVFNVYFSPVDGGPFQKINSTPINGTFAVDAENKDYSKNWRGFYIVEAILLQKGNAKIRSESITYDTDQNRWVQLRSEEIQRREYILLKKFVGIKSYLFRRKHYGERCPECWDYNSEKAIKDNCDTCIGTTFKGGYFPGNYTLLQYDSSPSTVAKTYFGTFEPNQISAWTISFPEIAPHDIIVRVGDWNLYRVEQVAVTELQGRKVKQIVQLNQLSKADVEYKLIAKNIPEFPNKYL